MMMNNFAAFILTHGRPNNIKTYDTLRKAGYTGKIYLVCDDEDKTLNDYKNKYKNVLVFNKDEIKKEIDVCDNFNNRKVILYARNACFNLAKQIGVDYFVELDDDYTMFEIKYIEDKKLKSKRIKNLDKIFKLMIEFLNNTNITTVAFGQGGDFVGGIYGCFTDGIKRKAMNSFFCKTNNPFKFLGSINEDVNTYTLLGSQGKLFLTILNIALEQIQTQANKGGMTEVYLDNGTYLKSFYSVMVMPSAVKIGLMGNCNMRIHHKIKWNNCVPKIINEKYKK